MGLDGLENLLYHAKTGTSHVVEYGKAACLLDGSCSDSVKNRALRGARYVSFLELFNYL
jgi:hypothetical protein